MLRRVALVRTDVSEELSASIIRVTGIGELGTTLAVTSNSRTLHGVTSQKTPFFIATSVKTSNLTCICIVWQSTHPRHLATFQAIYDVRQWESERVMCTFRWVKQLFSKLTTRRILPTTDYLKGLPSALCTRRENVSWMTLSYMDSLALCVLCLRDCGPVISSLKIVFSRLWDHHFRVVNTVFVRDGL
jgi:hypothetical protein